MQSCTTIRLGNIALAHAKIAYQLFTRLVFWGSSNSLPLGHCADLIDQYVERHRFA